MGNRLGVIEGARRWRRRWLGEQERPEFKAKVRFFLILPSLLPPLIFLMFLLMVGFCRTADA